MGATGSRTEQITQPTAPQVTRRLGELAAEFAGWRIGRGGSGHWWAVRGNELIRTLNADELRDRLLTCEIRVTESSPESRRS